MKLFLAKLALWTAGLLLILGTIYAFYLNKYPPKDSFYMASLDKHSLLLTQAAPRLIFIGGSATAFGVDSGLVARRCGFHPVNMGLHLRIGLETMLGEVLPSVRPGDVVIVSPEYGAFDKYDRADPEFVARLIECRPALLRALSPSQLKEFLDQGWAKHVGRVARSAFGGLPALPEVITGVYRRTAFNPNGDMVAHHGLPTDISGRWSTFARFPEAESAITRLNDFAARCGRRRVRVFFSHPPLEQRAFNKSRRAIGELERGLKQKLTFPQLDAPEEMVWPEAYFFDTTEHLNLKGKILRSELIAERLSKALATPPAIVR